MNKNAVILNSNHILTTDEQGNIRILSNENSNEQNKKIINIENQIEKLKIKLNTKIEELEVTKEDSKLYIISNIISSIIFIIGFLILYNKMNTLFLIGLTTTLATYAEFIICSEYGTSKKKKKKKNEANESILKINKETEKLELKLMQLKKENNFKEYHIKESNNNSKYSYNYNPEEVRIVNLPNSLNTGKYKKLIPIQKN